MYKVLIIDDEAPARIAISRLGHWADYHITELYQETNGAAALKTMWYGDFDFLMDFWF